MKIVGAGLLMLLLIGLCGLVCSGCGPAKPCGTSLVTLDETRLDVETYEQEAAETAAKVADLEKQLSEKQNSIDQIKDQPAELERKVRELKKGSGRE